MPYVFYDLETSGLEKAFDQIFQFGAIYADDELNIIDSIDVRCNRLPEIVPSPKAMIVTRVSPDDISSQSLSHYDMMHTVSEWITSRIPSTFIGHNSIDFDEKFLRFSFYKTLHNPYLTSSSECKRSDTMLMCHAAFHHAPGIVSIAEQGGKLTFRLGPIARANGIDFPEDTAHDAFADINATLELAKYIRKNVPEVWVNMNRNSSAEGVVDFLNSQEYAFLSAVYFGRPYAYAVCKAAASIENPKEIAVFDLSHDPNDYVGMEVYELVGALGARNKPFRIVKANNSPILFPKHMPSKYLKDGMLPDEVYMERSSIIRNNLEFQGRLAEALPQRFAPDEAAVHVEDKLYTSFFLEEDQVKMAEFHDCPWKDREQIVESFSDPRLREIGFRLICQEAPEFVDKGVLANYQEWVDYRLTTTDSVRWNTITNALTELSDIAPTMSEEEFKLHTEIRDFLINLSSNSGVC